MARIQITLVRRTIGQKPKTRTTVRCLGLRKIGSSTIQEASPQILGMVGRVRHLVETKEVE